MANVVRRKVATFANLDRKSRDARAWGRAQGSLEGVRHARRGGPGAAALQLSLILERVEGRTAVIECHDLTVSSGIGARAFTMPG